MSSKWMALALLLGVFMVRAQQTEAYFDKVDSFLKIHVTKGKVDYKAIKSNPQALNDLVEMAKHSTVSLDNPKVYKAFWINTYNILVIKGIVENYPLGSPLDVDGFFDKNRYEAGGTSITLNGIENELLRAKFPNEPRFHFVLVCAGLGCPPLINEAYRPETLENQLQAQTIKALNNPDFIRVEGEKVRISQIFEWYQDDFERAGGAVSFINTFRASKLPDGAQIGYYPYDWNLNSN